MTAAGFVLAATGCSGRAVGNGNDESVGTTWVSGGETAGGDATTAATSGGNTDSGDGDGTDPNLDPGRDTDGGVCGELWLDTCDDVEVAFWGQSDSIRSCEFASDCGQILTGTSCGCTQEWVARNDADASCFYAVIDRAADLGCELPLESDCDCPPTEGFVCRVGRCDWGREAEPTGCDVWKQDCGDGEKCSIWSSDGRGTPDVTRCVPVSGTPAGPGERCTRSDSLLTGVDNCDAGSTCYDIDPVTLVGTCVPVCTGEVAAPRCPDGLQCEMAFSDLLPICLP